MELRKDEISGLYVPLAKVLVGGVFTVEHYRGGKLIHEQQSENLFVNQGLDYLLDVAFSGRTPITNWYIGLFKGNATPAATDTAQNVHTRLTELTEYAAGQRQAWVEAGVASQTITNSASKAVFNINATVTGYGAFLASAQATGNDAGAAVLAAASRFASSRDLQNGDQLQITYQLSAADAG